jgi:hypothetical protein
MALQDNYKELMDAAGNTIIIFNKAALTSSFIFLIPGLSV